MRKSVFIFILCGSILFGFSNSSRAASQDECAIWLCLPGGFPDGCSAAHRAFKKRLKKRKPPLPSFASCAIDGDGRYEVGRELYEPCGEGYELVYEEGYGNANCVNVTLECRQGFSAGGEACDPIPAIKRAQPNFIEMWANGEYIGKFWY